MEAYNRFNRCIFEWERTLLKIVGHDFLGGKFERNIVTFTVYFLVIATIITMGYTFVCFDILAKIFTLLFFLILLQVILRIVYSMIICKNI